MRKIIKEKREIKYKIIEKIDRNTITIRHLILKIQYRVQSLKSEYIILLLEENSFC